MHKSSLDYQTWAIALYLFTSSLKGVSSMKLHRDLDITQKSAWLLVSKLRKAYEKNDPRLEGIVEVDETYVGGKESNKHNKDKLNAGRGTVGKTAVVGMKERESKKVIAKVVENTKEGTEIHTDENKFYKGLENYKTTNHNVGEYVVGNVHSNGVESFWSMFKRAHKGVYHKMSLKHLVRYVKEFVARNNMREMDTIDQIEYVVENMKGKRLEYKKLIEDNGLDSGNGC